MAVWAEEHEDKIDPRAEGRCEIETGHLDLQTDAVSSSGHLPDSASLQRDIHRHLLSLGFSKNGSGYFVDFVDGELSKQKIRNLHAAQRLLILEQRRAFVETHGSELAEHFASGNQVDPALIDPELVEVRPESLTGTPGSSDLPLSCGPFPYPRGSVAAFASWSEIGRMVD